MSSVKYYSVIEHMDATDSYAVMSDIKLTFLCSQSINESLNMHAHTFTNKPTAGIHKSSQKDLMWYCWLSEMYQSPTHLAGGQTMHCHTQKQAYLNASHAHSIVFNIRDALPQVSWQSLLKGYTSSHLQIELSLSLS